MSELLRDAIIGLINGAPLAVPSRIASAKLPFAAAFDIWARAVSSLIVSAASTTPRLSATTEGLGLDYLGFGRGRSRLNHHVCGRHHQNFNGLGPWLWNGIALNDFLGNFLDGSWLRAESCSPLRSWPPNPRQHLHRRLQGQLLRCFGGGNCDQILAVKPGAQGFAAVAENLRHFGFADGRSPMADIA